MDDVRPAREDPADPVSNPRIMDAPGQVRPDERYRTMMEAARDAIFLMDSERFVLFNKATLDLFRCTEEALRDHTPWEFSPVRQPDGRTSREAALERIRAARDGTPQLFHWVHQRLDGSRFDAEVSLSAIEWDDDELNLIAVVRDLSERVRIESELRRSEERFRRIVEDQTDFIVRWMPGGRRTFVNRAYCDFYGITPEEANDASFIEMIHPDDRATVQRRIANLNPDEPVSSGVHRSLRPDGSIAYTAWTDRAFFDEAGTIVGYQSVGRDVTEVRRLEEQLRQSQKLEALGRLAGGIAHDFNNALAIILGYAELLREEEDEGSLHQEHIRRIIGAAERSANINYQLLTFARKSGLERVPLRVNEAVSAVAEILEATLPKTVTVTTALSPDGPVVEGDASQIENMVLNLGINAGHAMPDGGTLSIATGVVVLDDDEAAFTELDAGRYVEVRVHDTGTGIPGEVLDHIFEPFFTTKGPDEGTGLGLSAVYGTVQSHGGSINVHTEPGSGTEFVILLPASTARATLDRRTGLVRGAGERILVVEDDADLRDYLTRSLSRMGYTVHAVGDGREAVELFRRDHATIDLVMLDLNLPGMNGRKTHDELQAIDAGVPILLSTGYATAGDGMEHLSVLQKPYTMAELSRRVRAAIDGS